MAKDIDQQFIEYIVKSLVGKPDAVTVERTIDERGVLLELTVDPDDLGRVIGKRGATAQSLRTLLRALGTKNDARYNLKIIDNGDQAEAPEAQSEDTETVADDNDEDSVASKTRKELEEFDDLDV
ncbi:MAG: KH domain-containing protein [Candidatus Saccharibacteria bacterium]|nr:KH domain-containing protein [Candidatus Saccharibacteria bacterium]